MLGTVPSLQNPQATTKKQRQKTKTRISKPNKRSVSRKKVVGSGTSKALLFSCPTCSLKTTGRSWLAWVCDSFICCKSASSTCLRLGSLALLRTNYSTLTKLRVASCPGKISACGCCSHTSTAMLVWVLSTALRTWSSPTAHIVVSHC